MGNAILKRRLNTFKSEKGVLKKVSTEVTMEVLRAWENWPGKVSELYRELGLSKMQLVTMLQKAKRLVKSGVLIEGDFKEVALSATGASGAGGHDGSAGPCTGIEVAWSHGKVIRFEQVDQLVDFLKKAA